MTKTIDSIQQSMFNKEIFHQLRELMNDERTQLVLWLSVIAVLVIVLLVVLGCTAPVSTAQSGLNRLPVDADTDLGAALLPSSESNVHKEGEKCEFL